MKAKSKFDVKYFFVIVAFNIVFYGCASLFIPTRYGPFVDKAEYGGYKEESVRQDYYYVTFKGNAFIETSDVTRYVLFRCSELTVINNKKYFKILSQRDDSSVIISNNESHNVPALIYQIKITNDIKEKEKEDSFYDAEQFIRFNSTKIMPSPKLISERGTNWILIKK